MKYESKEEVMRDYKNGKLAEWELEPILDNIEFEENLKYVLSLLKK